MSNNESINITHDESPVLSNSEEPLQEEIEAALPRRNETPCKVGEDFEVSDKGVFYLQSTDEGGIKRLRICDRLDIVARTRDKNGNAWGSLLRWKDADGRGHEWAMPWELLAGDGTDIRKALMSRGLRISPSKAMRTRLVEYLNHSPEQAVWCVSRVGWHEGTFVLPDVAYGSGQDPVIFQSAERPEHSYQIEGSLSEWQDQVARYTEGNSRLAFAIAAAFAPPLLAIAGEESGGFHLQGGSSTGKTTALRVAASVWGGPSFRQNWRATANGLEAVAELHNDALLCLDEIGQADGREAGDAIYMLANGSGKVRANRSGGSRSKRGWRTLFISTGEVSLRSHMQAAAKLTRAGQDVRLADIPMAAPDTLHGFDSADSFARQLREASDRYYGVAIREFLSRLVAEDADEIAQELRTIRDEFLRLHVPPGASGEVSRVAGRFALVAAAGALATMWEILPWPPDEAAHTTETCFKAWLASRGSSAAGDEEAAITQVRAFLEAHGSSRFEPLDQPKLPSSIHRISNRAGFRQNDQSESAYLILAEVFRREVCAGFESSMVAEALSRRGYLKADRDGRHTTKLPIVHPEVGRPRVFRIAASIMEGEQC